MDEELKRVLALDDEARADAERDEAHRAWRAKRSAAPTGVDVDEWLASRRKQKPMPPQQQQSIDATAEWNKWFSESFANHIKKVIDEYHDAAVDGIGEAFSLFRAEERKLAREHVAGEIQKLQAEISTLRGDVEILRGIQRGEIAQIKGKADAA